MKKNKRLIIGCVLLILFCVAIYVFLVNIKDRKEKRRNELEDKSITLNVGEEMNIDIPNTKNHSYIYTSSDPTIADVDVYGKIMAKKEGTVVINITSSNEVKAKYNVSVESQVTGINLSNDEISAIADNQAEIVEDGVAIVKSKIIEQTNIKLNKKTLSLEVGNNFVLSSTLEPINAIEDKITWTSSNPSIALVDTNGKITAKKVGTATITAKIANGKKATCYVTVKNITATSIRLNNKHVNATVGTGVTLKATILPTTTYDKSISWFSSDNSIATVSNGRVIGKRAGVVRITAKTSNGKTEVSTVEFKSNTHNKKAIFFGDSITFGYKGTPYGYSWANYIGDNYDLQSIVNAGKPGWFISNTNDKFINSQVEDYSGNSFDYVILHGGTNDISAKVGLGSYDINDFSGNYDDTTVLGGLETYIYTAKKQWPNAKIGYIINYPTPLNNDNRKNLSASYYTSMKKVLDKWGIKYLDLYFGTSIYGEKYSSLLKVDTKTYLPDTLHLNKKGYEVISPYIYMWMNTL